MSDTPTIREMHGLSDKPRTFDQVAITCLLYTSPSPRDA